MYWRHPMAAELWCAEPATGDQTSASRSGIASSVPLSSASTEQTLSHGSDQQPQTEQDNPTCRQSSADCEHGDQSPRRLKERRCQPRSTPTATLLRPTGGSSRRQDQDLAAHASTRLRPPATATSPRLRPLPTSKAHQPSPSLVPVPCCSSGAGSLVEQVHHSQVMSDLVQGVLQPFPILVVEHLVGELADQIRQVICTILNQLQDLFWLSVILVSSQHAPRCRPSRRRCRLGRRVPGRDRPNRSLGGTLDLAIAPERRPRKAARAHRGTARSRPAGFGRTRERPRTRHDPLQLGGHGYPDDAEQLVTSRLDFLPARRAGTLLVPALG